MLFLRSTIITSFLSCTVMNIYAQPTDDAGQPAGHERNPNNDPDYYFSALDKDELEDQASAAEYYERGSIQFNQNKACNKISV